MWLCVRACFHCCCRDLTNSGLLSTAPSGQQLQPFVGTLVAYNQAFEKTMLKHLANHFPEEGQLWLNGFLGGELFRLAQ